MTNVESDSCEGKFTKSECKKALKEFGNQKSPGNDGLTAEFYKYFWEDLGDSLVNCFNEAYDKGTLPCSQRQSVITLLDKNKDRLLLKNWRPISLLNTDYKIVSKTLANRLTEILPSVIRSNQAGYVKGRNISDNIRTVYDTMHILKAQNRSGILACVDFEKAFDSIEWNYLVRVLEKFNFGN